jgi:fatty acid kinase fatty acid binding subunit
VADPGTAVEPRGVQVVTDSTTYVPPELLGQLGVEQVSLYVGWNGDMEREDSWTDLGAFYERLRDTEKLPTTSQPSVGDFEAVYEPALRAGRDVVSIHIASGISGTCDSAREAARALAARGVEGRIEVVDGQTGAGGLGCIVLAAASSARLGSDADEVVTEAHRTRESLAMWFCLDTLEYLRRGGRIGAAQALLGSALKIKPILTIDREIMPIERVRTASRAFQRMVDHLIERKESGADLFMIQHIQAHDVAERLVERGREIYGREPEFVSEIGPVIGAHVGPGLFGVTGLPSSILGPM